MDSLIEQMIINMDEEQPHDGSGATDSPLVSVVIPTYNYARFVTHAVDSALAQTYSATEIIVVDDGSTDDTRHRLAPYRERIRYIWQENKGLSAARNTGIRHAKGGWVGFLDADDLWHPRKLEAQVGYLARHRDIGLLAVDCIEFSGEPGSWPAIAELVSPPAQAITVEQLAVRSRFGPSGALVRKACFDEVGLFDEAMRAAEDVDMWIRILSRYPIVKLQLPLFYYRLHPSSQSQDPFLGERYCTLKLEKVFGGDLIPARSLTLRRRAYSYNSICVADAYHKRGYHCRALAHAFRSIIQWPLPHAKGDLKHPLDHYRGTIKLLLVICKLRSASVGASDST